MQIVRHSVVFLAGLLLLLLSAQIVRAAQDSAQDLPSIVMAGLDAYKMAGPDAAVTAWIKGSAIEGNKDALGQANVLRQIQLYYGAYKSFELVHARAISANTKVIYLVIDFEKGPMFARFDVYKTAQGWILTSFDFNTKEGQIFPSTF